MQAGAIPDQGETIRAQAIAGWLDQRQRRGAGHRRIRGVAPSARMRSPACAASGWDVATTLRAKTGIRVLG